MLMDQARFADVVGRENVCDSVLEALVRARTVYEAARPPVS